MPKLKHENSADSSAREVARLAGVSLSTVSRVFRGSELVSDRTSELVRSAASRVGYQPSSSARSLRTGVSSTVGYLLRSPTGLLGEFHAKVFAAVEQALAGRGYQALVTARPADMDLGRYARGLLAQESLFALIVQADELTPDDVGDLAELPRPVILLNFQDQLPASAHHMAAVGFDNRDGIRQAVRHLAARGHHRIAFIGGTPSTNDARHREESFRAAMTDLGLPLESHWIRPGHFGEITGGFQSGRTQMDFLLAERPNAPTAIVAASDEIAIGALQSARRCGVSVPEELSIVGYDNHSWSEFIQPALTTIDHDGWELGLAAARALFALQDNPSGPLEPIKLPVQLIPRATTARVPT